MVEMDGYGALLQDFMIQYERQIINRKRNQRNF